MGQCKAKCTLKEKVFFYGEALYLHCNGNNGEAGNWLDAYKNSILNAIY